MAETNKKDYAKPIKAMFEANTVRKMRGIEDINPTFMSQQLGINHSRYLKKLQNPEEFTFRHIAKLAKVLGIDIQVIIDIIKKEISKSKTI